MEVNSKIYIIKKATIIDIQWYQFIYISYDIKA